MKKNVTRTLNTLYTHRYMFIALTMLGLFVVFLIIGNLGMTVSIESLNPPTLPELELKGYSDDYEYAVEHTESGKTASASQTDAVDVVTNVEAARVTGKNAINVCLYGTNENVELLLNTMKQPWHRIEKVSEGEGSGLVVICTKTISRSDTTALKHLADNGTSLLFISLPDDESLKNTALLNLLGIESVGEETTWVGLRTSNDLNTGIMIQENTHSITADDITLAKGSKIYANALPENFEDIQNMYLPALIWRHADLINGGKVYVFNGDFCADAYGYCFLPVVLGEVNGSFIYPIVNALCTIVNGYPYTDNAESEAWMRLYTRNKLQIQQDLLASQLKRYSKIYNARLTCISPDYDELMVTKDTSLRYYVNEVKSSRGMVAKLENGIMSADGMDGVRLVQAGSVLNFVEDGVINLPVTFNSTIDDPQADGYLMAASAGTYGYFAVGIDYDLFLQYDGEEDKWSSYCSNQEVTFGIMQRDYPWLDNVTAQEAAGRILQCQTMDMSVNYGENSITVKVQHDGDKSWFMLRCGADNVTVDNGTAEKIGRNCFVITLTEKTAVISWEEN